jgi:hypothetical protein
MTLSKLLAGLSGAAAVFAALPAGAVAVVHATRVEIVSAVSDYIQIAEAQAFEFGTGDNVASAAEGGSASAYSSGFGTSPGGAIDGDDYAYFGPWFYHSAGQGPSEKLTLLLARPANLTSLRIAGRAGCCRERDAWSVSIFDASDTLLFSGVLDARNSQTFDAVATFDDPPVPAGVPEPSAWALMILGFGAAGAALRARRRPAPTLAA